MADKNYWIKFWNTNTIIDKKTAQEKVGRTINGVPIDEASWQKILVDLEQHLQLHEDDILLDIAAGSGVISIPFSKKVKSVTAIDISEKLLSEIPALTNLNKTVADARTIDFQEETFTKVVLYFALQHFDESETLQLLQKIYKWLAPGGILFIGDIPDDEKKFTFFNNPEREQAYFLSVVNNKPIIGSWFSKDFIKKAGMYVGFSDSKIITQPVTHINAHYRFDAKFIK